MIPLYDDNPAILPPVVTVAVIVACLAVWLLVQGGGFSPGELERSICSLGTIPAELTGRVSGRGPCRLGGASWSTLITSMFLHGGWMHILGNLWFLWIFGNNVEDSMGHARFAVFYLATGVVAGLAQVYLNPTSPIPSVGASGAISGVMGAYAVLYPRARVDTLFFFFFFFRIFPLPAWLIIGYWFLLQVLSQVGAPAAGGGVAYGAHIGGFLAGVVLIPLFRNPELMEAKRVRALLDAHRTGGDPLGPGGDGWW